MAALAGEHGITYDARGLVEPDDSVPDVAEVSGTSAVFDAKDLTTRKINLVLRQLVYERGIKDVTIKNPGAKHSLGTGILTRCKITFASVRDRGREKQAGVSCHRKGLYRQFDQEFSSAYDFLYHS